MFFDNPFLGILLAIFFVAMNAFYVLAEFAIVKVRRSRIQELNASGHPLAPLLEKRILPQLDAYLSATQIGITIASLALGWIGEATVARVIEMFFESIGSPEVKIPPSLSFGISFFLVTAGHVIFGELIPKSLAILKADTMALWCARPLRFSYLVFYPILFIFNTTANAFLRLFGIRPLVGADVAHTAKELRILMSASRDRGVIDPQVHAIIDNAFQFRVRTVREVMVSKDRVAVLALSRKWEDNWEVIRANRHTRYPLCKTGLEDCIGLIHVKDLTLRGFSEDQPLDFRKIKRKIVEIPAEMSLDRALTFLRSKGSHLALVRSKEGAAEGIVCLEDVVELIVGSLEDEFDREEKISILDLLKPEAVSLKAEASSKQEVLSQGVDLLLHLVPHLAKEKILGAIEEREKLFSTGIGGGVAIPHAQIEELDQPIFGVMKLKKGIHYGSIDLMPVRLIFIFLLPESNPKLRIRFFAEIARLLQSPNAYSQMMAAATPEKLIETIQKFFPQGTAAR